MGELRGTYVDVAEAAVTPPQWVVEDLLPLGLTILGAPPKSGKSTWTMILAALIADWHCKVLPEFLSKPKRRGPTLVLSAEADPGELRYTLEQGLRVKPKADGSILVATDPQWDFKLDTKVGMKGLLHDLNELDPRLCVMDPFRKFHNLEEKDSAGMVQLLSPLRKWAMENDSAFVVVHHTTKPPASEAKGWNFRAADLRGSGAIFGEADGVLMLTPRKQDDPTHVFVEATFKRAKGWESELQLAAWNSPLDRGCEGLMDLEKSVLKALKQKIPADTIEAQLHISKSQMVGIVKKLRRNGVIK